jgi:hypothetical protein
MQWISRILPLHKFTDICRNVFFPISDYGEIDFILANGYLSHVFSEYMIVTGTSNYRRHYELCRSNFQNAIARLPLLLPASLEVIAALALGVGLRKFINDSELTMAGIRCHREFQRQSGVEFSLSSLAPLPKSRIPSLSANK